MNIQKMAHSAVSFTSDAVDRWSDRLAGRPACLACGDHLFEVIDSFSDSCIKQSFDIHPNSFLGYMRINVALYAIGLIAIILELYGLAFFAACFVIFATLSQSIFYWEYLDPLFKKMKGQNIIGTIEPAGEVKQQIIISAHHDSAHIFNFLEKDAQSYPTKLLAVMFFQIAFFILSGLLTLFKGLDTLNYSFHMISVVVLICGLLPVMLFWNFTNRKKGTPGAGDNLICSATGIEVGKYFAAQKSTNGGLQHTRLLIASWDAEECGLRGARAYIQAYGDTLHATKTYNFNQECYYDHKVMSILISDLNGFVPLSDAMASMIQSIARPAGYELSTAKFPFLAGSTDAAEFAKAGVEAICLHGMSTAGYGKQPAYHTTRDTIDAVDPKAVEIAIDIGIRYVEHMDGQVA